MNPQNNPQLNPQQTPAWDPNSVADYAVKNKLVDAWNPQNAAALFEKSGLGTAQQYLSAGANNAAYNMALLAKLKGYNGTTDPKSISSSSSIKMGKSKDEAMGKAGDYVNPPDKTQQDQPKPPTEEVKPDPMAGFKDPQLEAFDTQLKTASDQLKSQTEQEINIMTENHAIEVGKLEREKQTALAAAEATWGRNNPYSSGTAKDEYMKNIGKQYDDAIKASQTNFNTQVQGVKFDMQNNLTTLQNTINQNKMEYQKKLGTDFKDYLAGLKSGDGTMPDTGELLDAIQTAMSAGKTFSQAKAEIQGALGYAKRVQDKADLQERHMLNMEAMAQERIDQMDPSSGKNQAKYAQKYIDDLHSVMKSTRGAGGIAQRKLDSAILAQSILNENKDEKGNYNISKAKYGELVLAAAALLSQTGTPTVTSINDIKTDTLPAKYASVINYIQGKTDKVPSQAVVKDLASIIETEGKAAENIRDTSLFQIIDTPSPFLDTSIKENLDDNLPVTSFITYLKNGVRSKYLVSEEPYNPRSESTTPSKNIQITPDNPGGI